MELLIFLVSGRDQMVSRQEIVGKLWGSNLFIDTEPNINNIVRKIRTALGDDSAKPRFRRLEAALPVVPRGRAYGRGVEGPTRVIQGHTIRFLLSEPVSVKLIERIAKFRAEEAVKREKSKLVALRKR